MNENKLTIISATVARLFMGFVFFIFGLNYFFHFINLHGYYGPPSKALFAPMAPRVEALITALIDTGYLFQTNKIIQVVAGLLLLSNRFVPMALVVLAPITLNIFLFNTILNPSGFAPGMALLLANIYLGYIYRDNYRGLFKP